MCPRRPNLPAVRLASINEEKPRLLLSRGGAGRQRGCRLQDRDRLPQQQRSSRLLKLMLARKRRTQRTASRRRRSMFENKKHNTTTKKLAIFSQVESWVIAGRDVTLCCAKLGNIYEKCQGGGWRPLLPSSTWLSTPNSSLTSRAREPVRAGDRANVRARALKWLIKGETVEKLRILVLPHFCSVFRSPEEDLPWLSEMPQSVHTSPGQPPRRARRCLTHPRRTTALPPSSMCFLEISPFLLFFSFFKKTRRVWVTLLCVEACIYCCCCCFFN